MKGIYLAAFKALHKHYDIIYQDINGLRDIGGDMLDVDLNNYDFIIATPPCNYYSRCNYRRDSSVYSLSTKHLLPEIIKNCIKLNKPFIIENVRNSTIFKKLGLYNFNCNIYIIGRHTYWTNIILDINGIKQRQDFLYHGYVIKYDDMDNLDHEGGYNVHQVIERFLEIIHDRIINYNYSVNEQLKLNL